MFQKGNHDTIVPPLQIAQRRGNIASFFANMNDKADKITFAAAILINMLLIYLSVDVDAEGFDVVWAQVVLFILSITHTAFSVVLLLGFFSLKVRT